MIPSLQRAVQAYRLGAEGEANAHLVVFLDAIERASAHPEMAEVLGSSTTSLRRLMEAQSRGDGIGAADALEYELLPVLQAIEIPSSG
jgi:hypothetical protein